MFEPSNGGQKRVELAWGDQPAVVQPATASAVEPSQPAVAPGKKLCPQQSSSNFQHLSSKLCCLSMLSTQGQSMTLRTYHAAMTNRKQHKKPPTNSTQIVKGIYPFSAHSSMSSSQASPRPVDPSGGEGCNDGTRGGMV